MNLRVKPLKQKDAGRGLATLDQSAMDELGVENGDYILIEGEAGKTVARIWPGYPEDDGREVIRIDGKHRTKIGAGIDDTVQIKQADVYTADEVRITLPDDLRVTGDLSPMIQKNLKGQAVTTGQTIRVSFGLGPDSVVSKQKVPLTVSETKPDGTVVVTESTTISIGERPADDFVEDDDVEDEDVTLDITYEDIGGLDDELEQVREMIELPMRHPELFQQLGIEPPKGVLLHGPPGTGKTLMARAVANEIDAHFTDISGPEIMSKHYGESEEQLREVFEEASEEAPAVIFVDEIDSIAPERSETSGDVERRIVAQLLSLMDGLEDRGEVTVIGATNRVDALDPALRRGGRFDREIEVGIPDKSGRKEILQVHTRGMPLSEDIDLDTYATDTHGFVGADIEQLAKEAAMNALRRIRPDIDLETDEIDADTLESLQVTTDDFRDARSGIEPSALREVFVEVPDVSWDDVGGLNNTKKSLQETIQWPLDHPDVFERLDLEAAKGVLLYGPPGTGKTLLAKAIANESESNFISIKGPELLNKYVGESEKGVREVFEKARSNAPAVVFFDEIDSIATERGQSASGTGVGERVVSQLLTELDGLEKLEDVVVIATSNRPDLIDNALLRPGRLDRHIHVPVPDVAGRRKIFEVHTDSKPLDSEVDLDDLAERTDGYVGADIEAVCREASMQTARGFLDDERDDQDNSVDEIKLLQSDFDDAIQEISPSVDAETKRHYEQLQSQFGSGQPGIE
ncbi:CDC48 family AAA ATPase [Halomicrobium katesii]|uniref:CDC48 family AAA ATPase n=1 Tax=Halomicrobium katesii TaxID=437163 RepID=UPI00037E94E0|nr:CDC48 family AAA ATPase [Halomicrobium katesii]